MLKQESFFELLTKKELSPQQYYMLYRLNKTEVTFSQVAIATIVAKLPGIYVNSDATLTAKAIALIKEIDSLFKPLKKLNNLKLLGEDKEKNIEEFLEIFPSGKLPSGKYAKGNKKNIETNFMWFFQEYNFSWEIILKATELYVNQFRLKNYMYMRTAMYFIKKEKGEAGTKTVESELANYCDLVLEGTEKESEEKIFKQKVV